MGLYFLFRGCSGVFASGERCVAGLSLKRGACGIAVWKVCQRCAEGWALERGRGEVGGDLFNLLVWLEINLLYLCVYLKEQFVLYIVRYKHFVMDIKRISIL